MTTSDQVKRTPDAMSDGVVNMRVVDEILTADEVARDLRCSKAHVYKAINGRVGRVSPLPAISMGRKKLVRRSALERWKRANERGSDIVNTVAEIGAV